MLVWSYAFAVALAVLVTVPAVVLCLECVAALLPRRAGAPRAATALRPRVAVVIPAHDEEAGLPATLSALMPQLREGDRVLVVADNCGDRTADIARSLGAESIVRNDATRRGKGFALHFGMTHLAGGVQSPDVVIVIDADCIARPGAIDALAAQVAATGLPAQGVYLLSNAHPPHGAQAISMLAFTVKNLVRPTGLDRLGLPCLPTGTGMAFPWAAISRVNLASGNIVEDMHLGVQLALNGDACHLCPDAIVTGPLPPNRAAARQQRLRWEHGHLRTLLTSVPVLLGNGIKRMRLDTIALAMELSIPPLSLLALLMCAACGWAVVVGLLGGGWGLAWTMLGTTAFSMLCVATAWAKFARDTIPLRTLFATPFYVLGKIPVYLSFLTNPQKEWVRTARVDQPTVPDAPLAADPFPNDKHAPSPDAEPAFSGRTS